MLKKIDIISSAITFFLLSIVAVILIFAQLVALNGVSERKALTAIGIWLIFHLIIMTAAGISAGWASRGLSKKFHWNRILAAFLAAVGGSMLASLVSCCAVILSILLAGIK